MPCLEFSLCWVAVLLWPVFGIVEKSLDFEQPVKLLQATKKKFSRAPEKWNTVGTYFIKRFSLSFQRESYSFHRFLTAENFSRIVDIYFQSKSRCWRGGDGHCRGIVRLVLFRSGTQRTATTPPICRERWCLNQDLDAVHPDQVH